MTKRLLSILLTLFLSPAIPAGSTVLSEEELGRLLYLDTNLSLRRNQSCNSCHSLTPAPTHRTAKPLGATGFVDPNNVTFGSAVSRGSLPMAVGSLNAPSISYARFSPFFHWNTVEGLYFGGQFWNGRAATLADQAQGPPLNPVEMAMPSAWAVVTRLKANPAYVEGFKYRYKIDLDAIKGNELAASDVNPPPGVSEAYNAMATAIAQFEKSRFFNRFNSKFDFVMADITTFSADEQAGFELFTGDKAQCSACHSAEPLIVPGGRLPPLFTDFSYDNLGVPRNTAIPGNPEPDLGLGGRADIEAIDPRGEQLGKHKVMGLRNIALTAPYMHNGVLATLEQVVHFYNTRDAKSRRCPDMSDAGFAKDCWPAPEVAKNVNDDELGKLGLNTDEERQLVAFMLTLTDDYPDWGGDPNVPPGTPSPFAAVPFPPAP